MKEYPILFSGTMSLAILEGRKTMTRRVVNPVQFCRKYEEARCGICLGYTDDTVSTILSYEDDRSWANTACPYGQVGDRLWVRETCWIFGKYVKNGLTKTGRQKWKFVQSPLLRCAFFAPESKPEKTEEGFHKRPSIFMPRWASRIALEITEVRVERLQGICEDDAMAEGTITDEKQLDACYVQAFSRLWQSINGEGSWDANPWVWVVGFKKGMRFNEAK